MADLGRALISKIIDENDLVFALNAGIRVSWFEDAEHAAAFRWISEYHARYGETPTERALKMEFPTYRLLSTPEPYEFYLDRFREQRKRAILTDTLADADEALKIGDSKKAQEGFSRGLLRLGQEVSSLTDENAVKKLKSRYDVYDDMRQHQGELRGIGTGFPTLDYKTGGYQSQQFILFGGTAKQGKSFLLMKSAIGAQEAGRKVLFVSFEMSQFEQLARYDAITCGMNAQHLLHGSLTEVEMKQLREGMRTMKNMPPFIISADISATTTVSGLAGKIEQHQPDIIFVDGVYLMENDTGAEAGSPQAYTAISRGLKRLAQRTQLPIVATTQALSAKMGNHGAVTLHSLGWSSAWSQDADLILGVERVPDEPTITLRIVAGRNVSPAEIYLACDWDRSTFFEMTGGPDDDH